MARILVPPDSTATGANSIRTVLAPSTVGADSGYEQQIVTAAGADGTVAGVSAYGHLRVAQEPGNLFDDPFDTLDTVDKWTASGGTVAATASNGLVSVYPNVTTASASSSLQSQPTFVHQGLSFLAVGWVASFETINSTAGTLFYTQANRWMGLGTIVAWNASVQSGTTGPINNGVGFMIDTTGAMQPVIGYLGNPNTIPLLNGNANLNVGRTLADGALHQFLIVIRGDAIYWYIDGTTTPVAVWTYASTASFMPTTQTMPVRFGTINQASGATTNISIMKIGAVGVGDTSRNSHQISDGVLPSRRARVTDPTLTTGTLAYGANERFAGGALNVNTNALQYATYRATAKPTAAALVANTLSLRASLHHAAAAVKTVRIRRIICAVLMSGVIEAANIEVHKITAAPTGTLVTGGAATASNIAMDSRDAAPEASFNNSLTAATSVGLLSSGFLSQSTAAALHGGGVMVYDWNDSGQIKPITLRAGVLEGIAIGIISSAAVTPTLSVEILYTEE